MKISRILGISACLSCFAVSAATAAAKNVLLLISDNHCALDLGCYGSPQVKTPNIDALASRGTRFPYAFSTVASCGPSRAVIYTGLLTHANGQYTHPHSIHNGVLDRTVVPVFDQVRKAGYRTALLGKANVGTRRGQYEVDLWGGETEKMGALAAHAERFIRESGDKPFFVVLAVHDPNPGSKAPKRLDPAKIFLSSNLPDRPDMRKTVATYYELIEGLDAGCGAALEMLQRTGKADSTLVMFFSDQGNPFPNGGYSQYEPGVHVPMIIFNPEAKKRGVICDAVVSLADVTPTILDWTGVKPAQPLHGRSILPVLEQTNTTGWDRVVLSHVMHEVTMYYPMRTIRERRYKMIWNLNYQLPWADAGENARPHEPWPEMLREGATHIGKRTVQQYLWRPPVELYDLQSDPDELLNLADDPKHTDTRVRLSKQLVARLRETGDSWLERYKLPMPGEAVQIGMMSPEGYGPVRRSKSNNANPTGPSISERSTPAKGKAR